MSLYIVATPIGNLEDITIRALRILGEVDFIYCEDTRVSSKLLNHYNIKKPLKSLNEHTQEIKSKEILELLDSGKSVAYISDAGTPSVSDPGVILCKNISKSGHSVIPIPGPSALTSIMSVSRFGGRNVLFEGFASKKELKRQKMLSMGMEICDNIVVYESPYRIVSFLNSVKLFENNVKASGSGCEIKLLVGREITKAHEEWIEGSVDDILNHLSDVGKLRGEFTVLIYFKK